MKMKSRVKISNRMMAIVMVCVMIFTMFPLDIIGVPVSKVKATEVPVTTGTITGKISVDGNPSSLGAQVELINKVTSAVVKTAVPVNDGKYSFTGLLDGDYIISASKLGYEVKTQNVNISQTNSVVTVDLTLDVKANYTITGESKVNDWYTSDVTLIAKAGYQIWNGTTYEDSYTIKTEGENQKLEVKLKNSLTSVESIANVLISIDKIMPAVSKPTVDFDNNTWKPSKKISFTATDLKLDKVYWSKQNNATTGNVLAGAATIYSFDVTENATYYVYAVDIAGNTTKETIEISKIDVEKPTITKATKSTDSDWSNVVGTIDVEVADQGGSEIDKVMYGLTPGSVAATLTTTVKEPGKYEITIPITAFNGIYHIYAYDKAGNVSEEKQVNVKIDTTIPTISSIVFKDSTDTLLSKIGTFITFGYFSNKDVKVTITGDDTAEIASISYFTATNIAGTESIANKTDNVPATSNAVSFTLEPDFEGYVFATAKDKAGNEMTVPTASKEGLMIENNNTNKPSIAITPSAATGPFNDDWFNQQVNIQFDVKDVKAGIAKVSYTMGNRKAVQVVLPAIYTSTITPTWTGIDATLITDGENPNIIIEVTDNAGNITSENHIVKIDVGDPIKPIVESTVNGNPYINSTWTNQYVVYKVTGAATKSGIFKYEYNIGGDWLPVTEGTEGIKNQVTIKNEGTNNIQFRSVSRAGKIGNVTDKYTALIDIHKPNKSTATIDGVELDNNRWYSAINKPVILSEPEVEIDRSINSNWYRLDEGSAIQGNSVAINNDTQHSLAVWTQDSAGNIGDKFIYKINIEKAAPIIKSADISFKPTKDTILSKIGNFATFGYFFNAPIKVVITASDPGTYASGVKSISYYTAKNRDGSEPLSYKEDNVKVDSNAISFDLPIDFEGYVFAKAMDKAGNEMGSPTVSSYGLMIESNKPQITITPSAETGSLNKLKLWYNGKVNINFNVTEDKSGIAKISYKIGSQDQVEVIVTDATTTTIPTTWKRDVSWSQDDGKDLKVTITVTDNAGNEETMYKYVNIDKEKPLEPTIETSYKNNSWTNNKVVYKITGAATVSKISNYEYRVIDNYNKIVIPWTKVKEGTEDLKNLVTINGKGKNNIQFRSVSEAGINGTENVIDKYIALIDDESPTNPNLTIDKEQLNNDRWYSGSDKTVALNIKQEEDRATNNTWYKLDKGEWTQGNSVFVSGDAVHTLVARTEDIAGNKSTEISYKVNIDKTLPIVETSNIVFAKKNTGAFERFMNFASFGHFFNEKISVTIDATDATSGVAAITYYTTQEDKATKIISDTKVDNNSSNKTTQSVTFDIDPNFKGYVFAKAKDVAENEMPSFVKSEGVVVKDKNKAEGLSNIEILPVTKPNSNGFYKGDVEVSLKVEDTYSGINKVKYTVGSADEKTYIAPNTNSDNLTTTWQQNVTVPANKNNSNDVIITVTSEDNSGNIKTQAISIKIDVTIPVIDVKYDNNSPLNEKYFKESRRATISLNELNFNSGDVKIVVKKEGVLYKELIPSTNSWAKNGDVHTTTINYDSDGDYSFDIDYTDLAGNSAVGFNEQKFVVDKTLPKIAMAYDNNDVHSGNYYKNSRTATITTDELNFNASEVKVVVSVTENGEALSTPAVSNWSDGPNNTHTARIKFDSDAKYSIDIDYKDLAGNAASKFETQTFYVDQTKPILTITQVKDLSANKNPVAPIITYSDKNIDIAKVQIVLKGNNLGNLVTNGVKTDIANGGSLKMDQLVADDNYVLMAIVTDKSDNVTTQSVSFSVNQHGSTFVFDQKDSVEGKYVNKPFKPSIKVSNVDEVNIVSLTLNGTNVDYTFKKGVITLNDEINKDGKYVIALDVKDTAGNATSMKPIEFFFDATKPKNIITGIKDGGIYFDTLDVVIKPDNSKDKISTIDLNDKNLKESDYTMNSDGSATLKLTEFKEYTLAVETLDAAGNMSDVHKIKFQITNNPFIRIYETKPVFYGVIIGGCAVILASIAAFIFFKKKKIIVEAQAK